VPCGHLNRAIDTQRVILERFGRRLAGVQLTGHVGVFTIRVDGKQIYYRTERFHLDRIVGAIEERI
jgi:predicted Rdx family selenoprotein